MQRHGWRIIPVNPMVDELFGERAYKHSRRHPAPGRPGQRVPAGGRRRCRSSAQAVAIGAPAVWLQLGIVSAEARRIAEEAGMDYVEDRCIAVERAAERPDPPHLTALGG